MDFPAEIFVPLVDFLQQKAIEAPIESEGPPAIPEGKQADFRQKAKCSGLKEVLWPPAPGFA